jgi:hypothetical protein
MEVLEALVALILVLGAVVVLGVLWRSNQWDQTEAMRALRRLAGAPDAPVTQERDTDSGSR